MHSTDTNFVARTFDNQGETQHRKPVLYLWRKRRLSRNREEPRQVTVWRTSGLIGGFAANRKRRLVALDVTLFSVSFRAPPQPVEPSEASGEGGGVLLEVAERRRASSMAAALMLRASVSLLHRHGKVCADWLARGKAI